MKTRNSFVSNSSSSSFVVIKHIENKNSGYDEEEEKRRDILVKKMLQKEIERQIYGYCGESYSEDRWNGILSDGESEFGWQTMNYDDAESKWNWMVLQAAYERGEDRNRLTIDEYISDLDLPAIDWSKIMDMEDEVDAYIDHQSIDPERTFFEIGSIGINEWLCNPSHYVHNGNDNG